MCRYEEALSELVTAIIVQDAAHAAAEAAPAHDNESYERWEDSRIVLENAVNKAKRLLTEG
jgi:hypothetical protein